MISLQTDNLINGFVERSKQILRDHEPWGNGTPQMGTWSNRMMVTELWVADELHRRGIGTRLMDLAKEKANEQGRRAIILETQSCNVRAIAFYRSQGFRLIGFDACCYANNDIDRHEIRFNFGFYLNKE